MDNSKRKTVDSFRPVPFYFINTTEPSALSRDAVFASMQKLQAAGFGGCIVFNKPPDGFSEEDYLEAKWFALTEHFAQAGRELGLQIWINDGFDFPPGDAGGRIQKIDPSLRQRMFVRDASGKIEVREVDWGFPAFEEPKSSELFIEVVYERYKKHLGKYFSRGITGFFSDADCRRFGPVAGKELSDRAAYYPCSKRFMEIFRDKYRYDLDIEAIMSDVGGQAAEDYWELSGELYARWFKNNHAWCRRNGLKYTFHTSDSGPYTLKDCKRSSIFSESPYLCLAQYCDYPGTDHELLSLDGRKHFMGEFFVPKATWGGSAEFVGDPAFYDTREDVRAKYASSAAFIHGQTRVMCEAFAATNWGCDFDSLRQIAAWQIMQGINFFVPHAWHHRLHGVTKYFAPPDFSEYGSLYRGIREFNDWLAEMCMLSTQGELVAPVAVVDPTRNVWRGESDAHAFFEVCDRLKHMPYGYVVVDEKTILARPGLFKVLVNPRMTLSDELVRLFGSAGGVIIGYDEIDKLPKLLGNDVVFEVNGELQYMRRRLDAGGEMLLAANIGNKDVVKGRLSFKGREMDVELHPGELAVIYDQNDVLSKPKSQRDIIKLPDEYDVKWEKENMLPLSRWEDAGGHVRTMDSPGGSFFFRWKNDGTIEAPYLLVPKEFCGIGPLIFADGARTVGGEETRVFADKYMKFRLDNVINAGEHVIEFRPGQTFGPAHFNNIYLSGNFSVGLEGPEDFAKLWMEYYSMRLFLPSKVKLVLGERMKKLRTFSWAEQGHPFYSGAVTYHVRLEFPRGFPGATLVLPQVKSMCAVRFNGVDLGKKIWPRYEYELPPAEGGCDLEMTVWNTLANMLEGYRAPSGIVSRPFMLLKNKGVSRCAAKKS